MTEIEVAVRLDDFVYPTEAMVSCIEWHLEAGLKVSVAVIPADLEPAGADYLKDITASWPGRLEITQHGFRHTARSQGSRWFEVGPGMPFDQQRRIIQQGARLLSSTLGDLVSPVFVPPFNGFDLQTVHAARSLGFEVLSAESRIQRIPFPEGIREVSTNLDVIADYGSALSLKSRAALRDELGQVVKRESFLGFLLHPDIVMPSRAQLFQFWSDARSGRILKPTTLHESRGVSA